MSGEAQKSVSNTQILIGGKYMKNLKKLLALVLVFALVLSFGAVAASAAFTDTASTKYGEAIDVLSGIKVIDGTTSTTFDPTGVLTREQAAKVITYMLLGPANAALVGGVSSQTFSDVATTRWSAGYIEYCASQGIIGGTGDGTFNPEGKLTVVAFTKLLLGALGYKADVEGLTGASWAINTAALATSAGLYDYTIPISNNNCTREQAAQLAFKALKLAKVQYSGGTVITIGDSTITTGAVRSYVTYTTGGGNTAAKYDGTDDGVVQFCEQHFPLLSLSNSTPDGFGRPAHTWINNGAFIGLYKNAPVKVYTSTMAYTPNVIATDLAGYTLPDNTPAPGTLYKAIDNVTTVTYTGKDALVANNGADATVSPAAQTTAAALAALTGNGKTVEFYADYSKHITKIVTITYTVGVISNIVTIADRTTYSFTSAGGVTTTGIDFVSAVVPDTVVGQTGMAKGDTITYAATPGGTTYVYPTTLVNGTATSASSLGTVTVSGTTYTVGNAVTGYNTYTFGVSSVPANYYVDQFGYVVKTTAAAGSSNYAYIVGTYGTLTSSVDGTVPAAQVKVVKTDGTVATYTLGLTKLTDAMVAANAPYGAGGTFGATSANTLIGGAAVTYAAGDYVITGTDICVFDEDVAVGSTDASQNTIANTNAAVGTLAKVYAYTVTDSTIKLEGLTDLPANTEVMTPGLVYYSNNVDNLGYGTTSSTVNTDKSVLVAASSVYVVYNSTLGTAALYTGSTGLPTTVAFDALDDNNVVMRANTATAATSSYVFRTETNGFTAGTSVEYAYVKSNVYNEGLVNGVMVYTYTATKADGSTIDLTSTTKLDTDPAVGSGLYTWNTDKVLNTTALATTATTTLTDQCVYDATLTVTGTLLNAGTGYYNMTDTTKTVYIDPTKGSVDGNMGYVVLAKVGATVTNTVETIYIVG